MFVEVCLPIHSYKAFTYKVPDRYIDTISIGLCVLVPFGKKNIQGHIVSISSKPLFSGTILSIKSIVCNSKISAELWKTILFVSKYYLSPIGKTAKTAIPINLFKSYKTKKHRIVLITDLGKRSIRDIKKQAVRQIELLSYLLNHNNCENLDTVKNTMLIKTSTIKSLIEKKYIEIKEEKPKIKNHQNKGVKLTNKQQKIYNNIIKASNQSAHLIHGVPGSGKTEIYIKLVRETVNRDRGAIILVPEISLTPQVVDKFIKNFGNQVALWHSKLTESERGILWTEIHNGNKKIVIGPRSAVFAPVKNLGIIIIDEEQESSYKQESTDPRYNARDVSLIRSRFADCRTVLLSATPSMETLYNTGLKKITKHNLENKFIDTEFPYTELVNISSLKNKSILSAKLIKAMGKALDNNEQVIILQNRRGYSILEKCKKCKTITECPNCAVTLTRHKSNNSLMCHYCEHLENIKQRCKKCSGEIEYLGHGTENVEAIIKRLFPNKIILRMDTDSTKSRNTHKNIIEKFGNGEADILIGTQMVAKGLDFSNVTLVGVVNADHGLYTPDFRASEKIFQLIYQVIGRAGRRTKKGTAIIQTNNPKDKYLTAAAQMKDKDFYKLIINERKQFLYPPFTKIARILVLGKNEQTVRNHAKKICIQLKNDKEIDVIGPSPAPINRIRMMYRYHLLIKTLSNRPFTIQEKILQSLSEKYFGLHNKQFIKVQIDIDPVSML